MRMCIAQTHVDFFFLHVSGRFGAVGVCLMVRGMLYIGSNMNGDRLRPCRVDMGSGLSGHVIIVQYTRIGRLGQGRALCSRPMDISAISLPRVT